jgi:hypothetical protein
MNELEKPTLVETERELEESDCAPGEVLITVQFSGFFNRTEMKVEDRHNDDIARWKGKFPDHKTAQAFIDNMAQLMSSVLAHIEEEQTLSNVKLWTPTA